MNYAKVLPATGAGVIVAGSLGHFQIALIAAGIVFVVALAAQRFFPISK